MNNVRSQYQQAYEQHGHSLSALFIPKGRQQERFDSLCRMIPEPGFSLLDFGCGFGDLAPYLLQRFGSCDYTGADLVPEFIDECRRQHPAQRFELIGDYQDLTEPVDYVVAAGPFNLLYTDSKETHWELLQQILKHLFSLSRKALAVNFMSDQVDFEQPGAYHQNPAALYAFASQQLSQRLLLDQSYMPYEFSLIVYRDQEILRPDNVYVPLSHVAD